jgi:hypothetical protein
VTLIWSIWGSGPQYNSVILSSSIFLVGNLLVTILGLEIALKETVGRQMGTFISCIPGKLAYFEDEDGRYILERKS